MLAFFGPATFPTEFDPPESSTAVELSLSQVASTRRHEVEGAIVKALQSIVQDRDQLAAFPAERIAIATFAKELAPRRLSALDDFLESPDSERALASLREQVAVVPWPIRDAIARAARGPADEHRIGKHTALASQLELLMGGTLAFSPTGGVQFAPTGAEGTRLDIHAASTVVKSLSSLVFHLRHRSTDSDLLVIDEPELNLHPDNQRVMARFLARMVNAGIRLVITTHSDIIVRELSNLVQLGSAGEAGKALATELGYAPEELLRPDQLGVSLCASGTVNKLSVSHAGFSIPTMDAAIGGLDDVSQRIYGRLRDL